MFKNKNKNKNFLYHIIFIIFWCLTPLFAHAASLAISINSPSYAATVDGAISITAVAQGADSSATVQFSIDGTVLNTVPLSSTNNVFSYTWNTITSFNGNHILSATITDGAQTAISGGVAVSVENAGNNLGSLGVNIILPIASAVLSGTTTISASTTGPYSIRNVQFILNNSDMGAPISIADTTGDYDFQLNTIPYQNGSYTLSAIVTDIYGHTSNSNNSITFTIQNALQANAPSIILTAPLGGQTVSGTVQVAAAVTQGAYPIQNVQFMLDGADLGSAVTTPISSSSSSGSAAASSVYTYSWDTTTATAGAHSLSAVVTDTSSQTTTSGMVNVTVSNSAPLVSITAPVASSTITGTTTLTATVTTNSSSSPIQYVQFMVDGNNVGVPVTYPITSNVAGTVSGTFTSTYSYTLDSSTLFNGVHSIGASVLDQTDHTANATAISITTSNLGSPNAPVSPANPISPTLPNSPASPTNGNSGGVDPNNTLVVLNGTYYVIKSGQLSGITSPGILNSIGYAFNQAVPASTADSQLPVGANVAPGNGSLVKTAADPTVYVIADQQRHPFTSAAVFAGLGYSFASVRTVTAPELDSLPLGITVSSATSQHFQGTDVSSGGTVYWLDDTSRHPYTSSSVYNSWHIAGNFSTVVPANSADLTLPVAASVVPRG
jgi:hypothetical protein